MRHKILFNTRLLIVLPIAMAVVFYFGACKSGEKPAIRDEHGHIHKEGDGHDHSDHKGHDHGNDFDHGHTHDSTGHDSLEISK